MTDDLRLQGDILLISGDVRGAQRVYDRHLASTLRDPTLKALAEAVAEGRLEAAERDLKALLLRDPSLMEAAHLLGEVLRRTGRLADADRLLAACLAQAPDMVLARQSHALTLFAAGRPDEALIQLDRLLAADPLASRARMIRAAVLTEIGDYAAAAEVTAALLEAFPDQPQGWLVHGAGLRTLGRIDEAIAAWRRCLDLEPEHTEALWCLANLKTFRFPSEAVAAMESRAGRGDLAPADRANLLFTLGKAHEDAGHWTEAFDRYARGNAVEHARRAHDPNAATAFVRRCKALFTPAFFAERVGWGDPATDPIFIVGLPRSGSTLIEQILASHPGVEGTRELHHIGMIAGSAPPDYPDPLAALPREACAAMGADYLARTRAHRRLGRPRFTDKAPENFLHTGLIELILPNAAIIDVRRHPLGCCLSAFTQHFASGWNFSYDLTDLGHYYADYVDLMAHFDDVLPGRIHRVIYEDLIADTEGEVRRLLGHLGLPFSPACLRFFDNPRPVATPSSEQVRRPISAAATDHWRNFDPWLGPLKAALGPVLEAYPRAPRGS